MKQTDIVILTHLRQQGRVPLTALSRKTKLPVSTIYDRLKLHLHKGAILRYTTLLNFEKIGYATRAYILLAVDAADKEKLFSHLKNHPNVNSLFRINNSWNVLMECVFKDMIALETFIEQLESAFKVKQKQVHYVLDEVMREGFLHDPKLAPSLL